MKTHLVRIGQRISFKNLRNPMKRYLRKWLNMEGKTLLQLKWWYKAHMWRGSKGMLLWLLPIMLQIQVDYLDYVVVSASYLALNWSSGSVAVAGYSRKRFASVAKSPPRPNNQKENYCSWRHILILIGYIISILGVFTCYVQYFWMLVVIAQKIYVKTHPLE